MVDTVKKYLPKNFAPEGDPNFNFDVSRETAKVSPPQLKVSLPAQAYVRASDNANKEIEAAVNGP